MMVRAYLNVRATGGAVFFPMRGENTRERWSPFKGEGDGGCSKFCAIVLAVLDIIRIFACRKRYDYDNNYYQHPQPRGQLLQEDCDKDGLDVQRERRGAPSSHAKGKDAGQGGSRFSSATPNEGGATAGH